LKRRTRLNAAHAGQEDGAEQLLVTGALADLVGDSAQDLGPIGLLDQADQWLCLGTQVDQAGSDAGIVGQGG